VPVTLKSGGNILAFTVSNDGAGGTSNPAGLAWTLSTYSSSPSEAFGGPAPANPAPDQAGHEGVWRFAQGHGLDSSTYVTLPVYSAASCGLVGVESWSVTAGLPSVFHNGTGSALKDVSGSCSSGLRIPDGGFGMHPLDDDVVAVWTSPVDGYVSVRGALSDADVNGGDGVAWVLGVRAPSAAPVLSTLASGSFANGGSSVVPAGSTDRIAVAKGSQIAIVVTANGTANYDATNVDVRIVPVP
jgi:hypothetical protein